MIGTDHRCWPWRLGCPEERERPAECEQSQARTTSPPSKTIIHEEGVQPPRPSCRSGVGTTWRFMTRRSPGVVRCSTCAIPKRGVGRVDLLKPPGRHELLHVGAIAVGMMLFHEIEVRRTQLTCGGGWRYA